MNSTNEKLKKLGNKKITLGFLALLGMAGCVLVGSIFPFVVDPSKIGTTEWMSNEVFVVFVVIYCMICVMGIGQAGNGMDARSQIAKAKVKFNTYIDKIERYVFEQWIERVLQPRDQNSVYKRVLRQVGIKQLDVVKLSRSDLKSLINSPQRIDNVWFDEITEEQYKKIIEIKNGKYNIKFVDAGWYLTDKHIDTELTRSERALREQKVKATLITRSVISKILMTVLVSVVLTMFVVDMTSGEQQTGQTLMKLFSRLMSMASSSFAGYLVGCQENDIDASYIEMKADTQKEFLEDKTFRPKDIQEIAKEKFAKKVQNDNIKYMEELNNEQDIKVLDTSSHI